MKAADLYCSAGGAAMGLFRAGFDVEGWDIRPQPHYPFTFHQGNALDADISGFDFVWASPPCQPFTRLNSVLKKQKRQKKHADLIAATRAKLKAWGGPYIIENVEGSTLLNPIRLCGSSFGLDVQRHRLFESNFFLFELPCAHAIWTKDKPGQHRLEGKSRIVGCYGNGRGKGDTVSLWSKAMGIDWMTRKELAQAIPPAYSEYLARQILKTLAA